jgi:hypothetical protein
MDHPLFDTERARNIEAVYRQTSETWRPLAAFRVSPPVDAVER